MDKSLIAITIAALEDLETKVGYELVEQWTKILRQMETPNMEKTNTEE